MIYTTFFPTCMKRIAIAFATNPPVITATLNLSFFLFIPSMWLPSAWIQLPPA